MSIRRGYWFLADGGVFDGPFSTIREAKEASSKINHTEEVSIRTMIVLERRDETGNWVKVH